MEKVQHFSWLAELPNEILLRILDNLNRFHLNGLIRVCKHLQALAQYVLEHKKKIRLCEFHYRVLVLSLPSKYDTIVVSPVVPNSNPDPFPRSSIFANVLFTGSPSTFFDYTPQNLFKPGSQRTLRLTSYFSVTYEGRERKVTLLLAPNKKQYTKNMFLSAIAADVCLFIVDPKEIDSHGDAIKEMIFGACFMMSARNVLVAIDMRNCPQDAPSALLSRTFNEAKTKIAKLLFSTVGLCYQIVPIDLRTGSNVMPESVKYEWFSGPSLKQLLMEDQVRTNFDEKAYKELCEEPFKMLLLDCYLVPGVGTVPEGLVVSGRLKIDDTVRIYPHGKNLNLLNDFETYHYRLPDASPGNVAAFNIRNIHKREIRRRFTHLVKASESTAVNSTLAFRANIVVMKSDRFTQHQVYNVLYGSARIRCILWWIFPEDGKNKPDRKVKIERKIPQKPQRSEMDKDTYMAMLKNYRKDVAKEREEYKERLQDRIGKMTRQPPKPKLRKATAILLPLMHYDIETYESSLFEKNYRGKVMLMEKHVIIGVGRVDRVINFSADKLTPPTTDSYRNQYEKVVTDAAALFKLPTEQKLLELFLVHVTTNGHAMNSIRQMKPLSFWKLW